MQKHEFDLRKEEHFSASTEQCQTKKWEEFAVRDKGLGTFRDGDNDDEINATDGC